MAADLDTDGPTAAVLEPCRDDQATSLPARRLLAALHRLVLERQAPALAMHYPSVGGTAPVSGAWPAARQVLGNQRAELIALMASPVQTNEVGRCGALLGALYVVAGRNGLPIRLFEIGSSAGLLLNVDRYAYAIDDRVLGDPASAMRLTSPWRGVPDADLTRAPVIAERAGCDTRPLDVATTEGRLTLTSFVRADSVDRLERLRGALAVAAVHRPQVEPTRAAPWLAERLAAPRPGTATVLWHSVVLQYLEPAERVEIARILAEAGARVTRDAPLVVVGMENEGGLFPVRLRTWPGGVAEQLGTTRGDGMPTVWDPR